MALTLDQAQKKLNHWLDEQDRPPSYSMGDRTITRAPQSEIRANIALWTREVNRLTAEAAGNTTGGLLYPKWS